MRIWLIAAIALAACRPAPKTEPPPIVAITVVLPGAEPTLIERDVVAPIEEAVTSIRGVRSIASRIDDDHAVISLEVATADLQSVTHDVRQALARVAPSLPSGMAPPAIADVRSDDQVVWLAVETSLPITTASDAVHELVPRLERLAGVARIELSGIAEAQVIVRPDLAKLDAAGVTMFDLLGAVRTASIDVPSGHVEQLAETLVKPQIKIRDVALVELGYDRTQSLAPAVIVHAQLGASKSAVRRLVHDEIAKFQLLPGMKLEEFPPKAFATHPLVISLRGPNLAELRNLADGVVDDLGRLSLTVTRDPVEGQPERAFTPDRDRAAQLGVPLEDIVATVRALGSTDAGELFVDGARRPIVVRIDDKLDSALAHLRVRDRQGTLIPLADVVTVTTTASEGILRYNRERAIDISVDADRPHRDSARKIVRELELPAGYRFELRGP